MYVLLSNCYWFRITPSHRVIFMRHTIRLGRKCSSTTSIEIRKYQYIFFDKNNNNHDCEGCRKNQGPAHI